MANPSSRCAQIGKATTASALEIDLGALQRSGLFSQVDRTVIVSWSIRGVSIAGLEACTITNGVQLMYYRKQIGYGWVRIEQQVRLASTTCTFGGKRYWFRCPAAGCEVAAELADKPTWRLHSRQKAKSPTGLGLG
jgi:hypothetical protein